MTRADSDAIYAYLMNQAAVKQANPSNDVRFPANIRASLHGWNLLFAGAEANPASAGQFARMAARPLPGGNARPLR